MDIGKWGCSDMDLGLGCCEIILAALFQSAVLHFQSVELCLPTSYNGFHQSFNDNDIVTMLCHSGDGEGRCAHSATVPTSSASSGTADARKASPAPPCPSCA